MIFVDTKNPSEDFIHPKGFGGGRGIRTPVPLPTNGFQDRLVMTASICLRVELKLTLSSIYQLRRKCKFFLCRMIIF